VATISNEAEAVQELPELKPCPKEKIMTATTLKANKTIKLIK